MVSHGLAVFGGVLYFFYSRYYALTQVSVLDEGAYLLKGLYFTNGTYAPFQDFGPLTNHMPLSFLIHGVIQVLFGPGVREARYFMLAVGLLMLAGAWLIVYRLRGPSFAALAVWLIAVNPGTARFYSLATSQGLIACMLVWTIALSHTVPGKSRALSATTASAVLAAVMGLTRINLTPVLPMLLVFIFWAHGRKAGLWALAAGALTFLAGNALFYPEVFKIWGYWLPESFTPFLDPWRQPRSGRLWDPAVTFSSRFFSLLEGLRVHFHAFAGLMVVLIFLRQKNLESKKAIQNFLFWAVLFITLTIEHALASIALNYCVFCFSVYLAFFAPLGVILLVVALQHFSPDRGLLRPFSVAVVFVLISTFLGLGAFEQIGDSLARWTIPPVRSILSGEQAAGYPVWDVFEARFGLSYAATRKILPAAGGLIIGLVVVAMGWTAGRRTRQRTAYMTAGFLVTGLLFVPTPVLGSGYQNFDCGQDTVAGYEALGHELDALISEAQQVYWRGGQSVVPLLYVPNARIYPSQINGHFAVYDYDNADELLKFGLWSEALSDQWLREADLVLIEGVEYQGELRQAIADAGLIEVYRTKPPFTCRPNSEIIVFQQPLPIK